MIDYSVTTCDTHFFATGFAFKLLDIHVKNSTFKFSWDQKIGVLVNFQGFRTIRSHKFNRLCIFIYTNNGANDFVMVVRLSWMIGIAFATITVRKSCCS
jgi:hypothetical protein